MCYCDNKQYVVLKDIVEDSIPDEALVSKCCWSTICRARSKNMESVQEETWSAICTKRGYLLARQNSRGF